MKPKYGTIETIELINQTTSIEELSPEEVEELGTKVPWFTKFAEEPELLFCMN